jgi:hypothetical protein
MRKIKNIFYAFAAFHQVSAKKIQASFQLMFDGNRSFVFFCIFLFSNAAI